MLELIFMFCTTCLSLSVACSLGDTVTCRVAGTYVVLVQQGCKGEMSKKVVRCDKDDEMPSTARRGAAV